MSAEAGLAEFWREKRAAMAAAWIVWVASTYPLACTFFSGIEHAARFAMAAPSGLDAFPYYARNALAVAASPEGALRLAAYAALSLAAITGVFLYKHTSKPERTVVDAEWDVRLEKDPATIARALGSWAPGEKGSPGFAVGYHRGRYITSTSTHLLALAYTGSGKSRRLIAPTAACVASSGGCNLVVTDPSGELYYYLAPYLRRCGLETLYIDLKDPFRGSRANPLAPLAALEAQGLGRLASTRADEIGAMFFPETGEEQSDAFVNPCAGLFAAVTLIVATDPGIPDEARHLGSVIRTLQEGCAGDGGAKLQRYLDFRGEGDEAAAKAGAFRAATGDYLGSIAGTLQNGIRPFASAGMMRLLAADDLGLATIASRPAALFIRIAEPGMPANKLTSLLLNQIYDQMSLSGERRGSNRETYFLVDEAASVPRWNARLMAEQGRKYGAHLAVYLQGLSGLDHYSTHALNDKQSIVANLTAKLMVTCGTSEDAEFMSRLSGERLVKLRNEGKSERRGGGLGASRSSGSSETRAPVWSASEILNRKDPGNDGCFLWQRTGDPASSGLFEPPLGPDPTATPLAGLLGTLGPRKWEERRMAEHFDELDRAAQKAWEEGPAPTWVPNFGSEDPDGEDERAEGATADEAAFFGL